ncbi:VWA domain-containing protein [Deinococcus sp. S9]|uniref:vWA domain-containing protein n=1 Tax=Deinococcus sp. S9 TaxID=2545754 RepID=UPI0010556E2E|nr:VWA domain-containing protein [Deinococcus sp. S9]TDE86357.1 VWA domain-containing protein [Deinococcus sp. S9]
MTAPLPADLSARVVAFVTHLRAAHGFRVGPGEAAAALQALNAVDLGRPGEVRDALRAVLTARREEVPVFDAAFDTFFRLPGAPPPPRLPPLLPRTDAPLFPPPPARQGGAGRERRVPGQARAKEAEEDAPSPATRPSPERQTEGAPEGTARPLSARLSPNAGAGSEQVAAPGDDLPDLLRAAGALVRAARLGRSRRLTPQARGSRLDARRTLRAAARTAGDPVRLRWLGRPRRAPRFLLVLDGSRSMGRSATLLLRFAFALHLRARRVEVYAFSTGLTRLTPLLRAARPGEALRLPNLGDAWGGGTRIGENLLRLAREERGRVNRDTVILILSDGLDTGDPEVLARALRDLAARAGLLVWLSPLAALPGYQPVQRAVRAALPYLDAFLPAGGVADLAVLGWRLRTSGSPRRTQTD